MTVKEFAAGSAKALLTTIRVLFRILVGLISAFFSLVFIAWAHAPKEDDTDGFLGRKGADGLTDAERTAVATDEGWKSW
ncbi:MAG: hypothetical protein AAGA91_20720 [Pseudomonadota bacterium]